MNKNRKSGNTLALVLVTIGIVALLIGFFVMNYSQLTGVHKEAQTAIDAAALAAAKDMGKVVVNGPLGRIGLVDDVPAFVVPTGTLGGKVDPRPVLGINTVMGTMRLDAIIASKLSSANSPSGNTAILYLIQQDLNNAKAAAQMLKTTLAGMATGGTAIDKYGSVINLKKDATDAYVANKRSYGQANATAPTLLISFGYLDPSKAKTNIPTPQPASEDPFTSGSGGYYTPYQNIPGGASGAAASMQFQFIPLAGSSVALISNDTFVSTAPATAASYIAPSVVQVAVDETVTSQVKVKGQKLTATLREIATAECGGTAAQAFPTGAFEISFANAGGLPDKTASPIDFSNVVTIMNAAPADATTGGAAANWPGQGNGSPQPWFKATGGPVPASAGASLKASAFKGITGQITTNPSVALSFGLYDWLRTLGIRPNITSVVNALKLANLSKGFYDLQDRIVNQNYQTRYPSFPISYMYGPDNGEGGIANNLAPASPLDKDWTEPAYAQDGEMKHGMSSAFLDISLGNEEKDRRNLERWAEDPENGRRQQSNMWGYVLADPVIADQARMVQVVNGYVSTIDGNPAQVLTDMYKAIKTTTEVADETQANAWKIVNDRMNKLLKEDPKQDMKKLVPEALKLEPRAFLALHNSSYCLYVMYSMGMNFKALTSLGANEFSPKHFQLAGADFYPATKAASVQQILAEGRISTGQDAAAGGPHDWCGKIANNISQLEFYKHHEEPQIGRRSRDGRWFEQGAWAAAPPPSSQNAFDKLKFIFSVVGGASSTSGAGTGQIQMVVGQAPFAGESILEGQQLYQSVHALKIEVVTPPVYKTITTSTGTSTVMVTPGITTSTVYQVQARDENTNAYPSLSADASKPNIPAGYFADMNATGGAKTVGSGQSNWCQQQSGTTTSQYYPSCPALAFEWQLSCPIAQTTSGDIPVPLEPVTFHPDYSYNWSQLAGQTSSYGAVSRTLLYEGCAGWTGTVGYQLWGNSQTVYQTNYWNQFTTYSYAYWSVGGLDFSTDPKALTPASQAGNGWYVGPTNTVTTTYTGSYVTNSVTTRSWTTDNYIYMPHS
jgi:hypothetical protein